MTNHTDMNWMQNFMDGLFSIVCQFFDSTLGFDNHLDQIDEFSRKITFGLNSHLLGMKEVVGSCDDKLKVIVSSMVNHDYLLGVGDIQN